jgi:hypothetical protein
MENPMSQAKPEPNRAHISRASPNPVWQGTKPGFKEAFFNSIDPRRTLRLWVRALAGVAFGLA